MQTLMPRPSCGGNEGSTEGTLSGPELEVVITSGVLRTDSHAPTATSCRRTVTLTLFPQTGENKWRLGLAFEWFIKLLVAV